MAVTRRMTRWTVLAPAFVVAGLVARWAIDERRNDQRLAAPTAPWPTIGEGPSPASEAGPQAEGAPRAKPAALEDATQDEPSTLWADPVDGACPPGYPVMVKLKSRLYHLPGMLAYERTGPDRCYATAEGAEADGFTRAKR